MKFYSELTKRLYNTEKELIEAETKVKNAEAEKIAAEKAKKEARAIRAKEVENAIKEAAKAQEKASTLLKNFVNDYGYFHTSYTTEDAERAEKKQKEITSKVQKVDTSAIEDFFDVLASFLH